MRVFYLTIVSAVVLFVSVSALAKVVQRSGIGKRLEQAISEGDVLKFITLKNRGLPIHEIIDNNHTLLHLLAKHGQAKLIIYAYILEGIHPYDEKDKVMSAAQVAKKHGHEELANWLVNTAKSDGYFYDPEGVSSDKILRWAAASGNEQYALFAVEALLLMNGGKTVFDESDLLHISIEKKLNKVLNYLATTVEFSHRRMRWMLWVAAKYDNVYAIELLLDSGANIDAEYSLPEYTSHGYSSIWEERTPLQEAASYPYSVDSVSVLLARGADVNLRSSSDSLSALDLALTDKVNVNLRSSSDDLSALDDKKHDLTPSDINKRNSIVHALIDNGAKITSKNRKEMGELGIHLPL